MANTVYANKVIEAKAKDLLLTALNARNYMTVDTSLAESAGMTKTINTYTYTGEAEELATGAANTSKGSITYTPNDYTVKRVQQTFVYNDDDFMKDPTIVDNMLKGANQVMVNKMVADFKTECEKATLSASYTTLGYDAIVDGIGELNLEDESAVFTIIPNTQKKELRKDDDYKAARMGEVVYTGQIGTVCGIPVIASKAFDVPKVMTKEAITLFIKKDVQVEQKRDIETKDNTVVLTTYYICALTDATKICKLAK